MAKVVPLANAKAFLDALEKSGLVGEGDLKSLRSSRGEDNDPKLVARELVKDGKLTKWQAGQLLHGFHQLMVGKYKMMDQLGSGEMGRVYLGEHAQLARKVSLKILSRKYTANPEILKKVLDDGRKASALDHRNLSHVFDVNSEDERYYLVTEFVEGKDLKQLVEGSGGISPTQAIEIVRQAAEGLEYAHGQGVIHGDLKPSNLIVDASGIVKIRDLGLARLTESSPAPGDESTEVATLAAQSFHAPEQASKREVSPLVDIYSLGAIFFYLLTGKPPLGGVNKAQDVKSLCPAVSDEAAEICAKMLAEDPAARPQTAKQVVVGLDVAARGKPKLAAKEEKRTSGEKPQAKQKKPLVAKALEIPFPTQPGALADVPKIPLTADRIEKTSVVESIPEPSIPSAPPLIPVVSETPNPSETVADDPFGGFSLETKRKRPKPPAEAAAIPAPAAASTAPAKPASDAPMPARSGNKPSMGIVIGAGIGGGVLILALGMIALFWALSRGGKTPDKAAIAKAEEKKSATGTPAGEKDPEVNPELNPEENPKVETPAVTKTPEKTTPGTKTPANEGPKTTVPMPNPGPTDPVNTGVKPPMTTPMPMPPVPMPKPEPVKPEPVKPMPMPEPTVPIGNPFVGFAKIVSLPPLEEKGTPVADATKPKVLGTIKIPAKALCLVNLKGGENAISLNAKQKFVMEAGNNGTSIRDWEFKIVTEGNNTPVIVAKLALESDQLSFQWTEEAAKQIAKAPYSSAPYLCNCILSMSAGDGSHLLALREPITGEPMKVDLEKPMSAKYSIEYPPRAKQIAVQLGPPEGAFPKFKFEKPEISAKDSTVFMTGAADDALILQFSMTTALSAKNLVIQAKPQYKIFGMTQPKPWLKVTLSQLTSGADQAVQVAGQNQAELARNLTIAAAERPVLEARLKKDMEDAALQKAQVAQLQTMAKELQGQGKIHFRIYYDADPDIKVELVSTGAAPPMAIPMIPKP